MIPCMLYAGDFLLIELLRELTVHIAHHRPRVNAVFLVFYRTFTDRLAAASDAY